MSFVWNDDTVFTVAFMNKLTENTVYHVSEIAIIIIIFFFFPQVCPRQRGWGAWGRRCDRPSPSWEAPSPAACRASRSSRSVRAAPPASCKYAGHFLRAQFEVAEVVRAGFSKCRKRSTDTSARYFARCLSILICHVFWISLSRKVELILELIWKNCLFLNFKCYFNFTCDNFFFFLQCTV